MTKWKRQTISRMKKKEAKNNIKYNREVKLQENSMNNFILMHLIMNASDSSIRSYF